MIDATDSSVKAILAVNDDSELTFHVQGDNDSDYSADRDSGIWTKKA